MYPQVRLRKYVSGLLLLMAPAALATPDAGAKSSPANREPTIGTMSVGLIQDVVQQKVRTAIEATSAWLEKRGEKTKVAFGSLQYWKPYRADDRTVASMATARIPLLLRVDIEPPPADRAAGARTLLVPIEVEVACQGAKAPSGGVVLARGLLGPSTIDGEMPPPKVLDKLLALRDFLVARLRPALGTPAPFFDVIGMAKCIDIDVRDGGSAAHSEVFWAAPSATASAGRSDRTPSERIVRK